MANVRNGYIPCKYPISVYNWSAIVMQTTPYPEDRVFRVIAQEWRKMFPHAEVQFYIFRSGFSPAMEKLRE